jgi:hypothetical protein
MWSGFDPDMKVKWMRTRYEREVNMVRIPVMKAKPIGLHPIIKAK